MVASRCRAISCALRPGRCDRSLLFLAISLACRAHVFQFLAVLNVYRDTLFFRIFQEFRIFPLACSTTEPVTAEAGYRTENPLRLHDSRRSNGKCRRAWLDRFGAESFRCVALRAIRLGHTATIGVRSDLLLLRPHDPGA